MVVQSLFHLPQEKIGLLKVVPVYTQAHRSGGDPTWVG
jgi:hypothetical protein